MGKRLISVLMCMCLIFGLAACGSPSSVTEETPYEGAPEQGDKQTSEETVSLDLSGDTSKVQDDGYTFGYNETFRSNEPITYTMLFSDSAWYPLVDTWRTEGLFYQIEKITNVHLEFTSIDSTSYMDKALTIAKNGDLPYIIPKIYYENDFVATGEVMPLSDWTQYMPNYTKFVEDYGLEKDLHQIIQTDGKYYRLPGLKEATLQDYSFLVRADYFEAAGIDVSELQKTWTWYDLYDALVKVKEYMVGAGIVTKDDYVWSDVWCGTDSGQYSGGCLAQLIGATYNINLGWATGNGLSFDIEDDKFEYIGTTDEYKEIMQLFKKFENNKILDPKTFTQADIEAREQFEAGKTAIMLVNRSQYSEFLGGLLEENPDAETEIVMIPIGKYDFTSENVRLECGMMVSVNAYEELGEEGFIKLLRFMDWLWYSKEGQTLCKWGVEGVTYNNVTDDEGNTMKALTDGYYCDGLSIAQTKDTQEDMRFKYGYSCGNFMLNCGDYEMQTDHFTKTFRDILDNYNEYRELRPLMPGYTLTDSERARYNELQPALTDNVNSWTLSFLTGEKDIDKDYSEYIANCEALGANEFIEIVNSGYNR